MAKENNTKFHIVPVSTTQTLLHKQTLESCIISMEFFWTKTQTTLSQIVPKTGSDEK